MKIVSRPLGITMIAIATVIALAFWFLVQQRLFRSNLPITLDRASVASTLGFVVADLVWAIPLLLLNVSGLLHL